MPPIKLGKTSKNDDRMTGKTVTVHPWITGYSKKDLIEKYNNENTRGRDKAKIKNELVRRGGVIFK